MPHDSIEKSIRLQTQQQSRDEKIVLELGHVCDYESFKRQAMPYAIGFLSSTHGLTRAEYSNKVLVFTPLSEEHVHGG